MTDLRKRFPLDDTSTVYMSGNAVYNLVRYGKPGIIAAVELHPGAAEAFRDAAREAQADAWDAGFEAARAATLDQLLRAAYVVDTRHHLHETTCSCGFEGNARKRTQTEHITTAVVTEYRAALIVRADELDGGTP